MSSAREAAGRQKTAMSASEARPAKLKRERIFIGTRAILANRRKNCEHEFIEQPSGCARAVAAAILGCRKAGLPSPAAKTVASPGAGMFESR